MLTRTHACRQVWSASKERLQRVLGQKTGISLWQFAHGRDERAVEGPKVRKSVGAEVNWGIRFEGGSMLKYPTKTAQVSGH